MEQSIRKTVDEKGNKSVSYNKSWDKNGIHNSIEVRQVKGGFIIRKSKYGKPADDPDASYIDEHEESISTTNPFEENKKGNENKEDKMFSFIDLPDFF